MLGVSMAAPMAMVARLQNVRRLILSVKAAALVLRSRLDSAFPSGSRSSNASLRPREISQVGRLLSLLRRHQIAVRAQVIDLPADIDMVVVLVAIVLSELSLNAAIVLHHRPGPRERVVDGGDLVVDEIGIGLVEGQPLL